MIYYKTVQQMEISTLSKQLVLKLGHLSLNSLSHFFIYLEVMEISMMWDHL